MLLLLLASAFAGAPPDGTGADLDGDGSPRPEDCDDGDPTVFPGSTEARDGVDHDCDGVPTRLSLRGRSCGCADHEVDEPYTEAPIGDTGTRAVAPLLGLLAVVGRRRRPYET